MAEPPAGDALLAAAVRSARFAVICTSTSGLIQTWNAAAERLYGWSEAEAFGQSLELLLPADAERSTTDQVAASSTPVDGLPAESVRLHKDGHSILVSDCVAPILDPDGVQVGAASLSHATDPARTSARDSADKLALLASHTGVGLFLRGATTVSYVNDGLLRLLGIDPGEAQLDVRGILSGVHPDDRLAANAMVERSNRGESSAAEIRMVLPDGSLRWIRVTTDPIVGSSDQDSRVAGTVTDISDLKAAEEALRESERRFTQIADSLEVGVTLRQLEPPAFLYVNAAFARIMGSSPAAFTAMAVGDTLAQVHPDDRERFLVDYYAPAMSGRSASSEHRLVLGDGSVRWVHATSHPVPGEPGRPRRAAGTVEDITNRKAAVEEFAAAQAAAEQANEAKTRFLSRMSHELRTPLNAVSGFAQLLALDELSAQQADAVGHILGGAQHLLELINDVLDISQLESDQMGFVVAPVRLFDVVDESLGLMALTAAERRVQVVAPVPATTDDAFVLADRRRLRQILLNLVSNAIKYNRPGGTVTVAIAVQASTVQLTVEDTGIGVSAPDLARMFLPFERLGPRPERIDGVGLGLALSRGLAESMSGTLGATSELDVGSRFALTLPRALTGPG